MSRVRVATLSARQQQGLRQEIVDFVRQFIAAAFDPYRPEQHYMRGPGPACRARREGHREAGHGEPG